MLLCFSCNHSLLAFNIFDFFCLVECRVRRGGRGRDQSGLSRVRAGDRNGDRTNLKNDEELVEFFHDGVDRAPSSEGTTLIVVDVGFRLVRIETLLAIYVIRVRFPRSGGGDFDKLTSFLFWALSRFLVCSTALVRLMRDSSAASSSVTDDEASSRTGVTVPVPRARAFAGSEPTVVVDFLEERLRGFGCDDAAGCVKPGIVRGTGGASAGVSLGADMSARGRD